MTISNYSSTPGSNNSTSPNGAPEGMAPSGVNDTIRQIMADVRSQAEDNQWFNWGDTPVRTSATAFQISATNASTRFVAGRRLRFLDSSNTFYGYISDVTFAASNTTITMSLDSGALTASLSAVSLAILTPTNISIPYRSSDRIGNIEISGNNISASSAAVITLPNGIRSGNLEITGNTISCSSAAQVILSNSIKTGTVECNVITSSATCSIVATAVTVSTYLKTPTIETNVITSSATCSIVATALTLGGVKVPTISSTDTQTNKTLTSPKIGTGIYDTNGNEIFLLTATASAVNELTYSNAATGNPPTFTASGGDTNISVKILPKGTGQFIVSANGSNVNTCNFVNSAASLPYGPYIQFTGSSPNDTTSNFLSGDDSTTNRFTIYSNGTYGTKGSVKLLTSGQGLQESGGSVAVAVATGGNITLPLNASFLAYNSANDTSQTGNGASPTVDFDTEIIDRGNNFASDTFTAPITGVYDLSATVYMTNISVTCTQQYINLITSNRTYSVLYAVVSSSDRSLQINIPAADMDAGDTAYITIQALGQAGNTITIYGTSSPYTFFSGSLRG